MSVTVIGAGLAGLATAFRLRQAGIEVQVLEANAVAGGRIQPALADGHQDLGPTWVWPYAQPVITRWLDELQLELFAQYDEGSGLLDQDASTSAQQYSLASQYGSARIKGGTHALIVALLDRLDGIVHFQHVVNRCKFIDQQYERLWQLDISSGSARRDPYVLNTSQLVVAIPPRLAANILSPNQGTQCDELDRTIQLLNTTPTWMAPHAKVVAVYETAFWRSQGLSGRVASQVGPLVEIHDHSGPDGSPAALFGFAGVSPQSRHENTEQFYIAIQQQLKRCFGEHAPEPSSILIKDWAFEPFTSTATDRRGDGAHPQVLSNSVREPHCERSMWFAVSETAERSPGLIEGALSRADEVASDIISAAR